MGGAGRGEITTRLEETPGSDGHVMIPTVAAGSQVCKGIGLFITHVQFVACQLHFNKVPEIAIRIGNVVGRQEMIV